MKLCTGSYEICSTGNYYSAGRACAREARAAKEVRRLHVGRLRRTAERTAPGGGNPLGGWTGHPGAARCEASGPAGGRGPLVVTCAKRTDQNTCGFGVADTAHTLAVPALGERPGQAQPAASWPGAQPRRGARHNGGRVQRGHQAKGTVATGRATCDSPLC
jgi:hypothetical protein